MNDKPRLIEYAFPLKQASLDSVHEKMCHAGHIKAIHIWPARRPLAACRAALIATLLPDPGTPEERRKLCEKIGGKVVKKIEKKRMPNGRVVERIKEQTEGGVLHWKREIENAETVEWFRQEIRKAYGGLPAPRPGLFFVYVVECEGGSYYIGHTDDLQRRWQEHLDGRGADWTKRHKPIKIVHFEEFNSREEAVKRESDLKTGFGRKWLKELIASGRARQAGRAPRVLDPFAGGGAIPLEAMRLGCEVTAVDINPVAWFILKCTLEYPQKLAGKTHPLPDFILENEDFMEAFYKAHPYLVGRTKRTKKQKTEFQNDLFLKDKKDSGRVPEAGLAWHVRAWGQWVLDRARRELARFYPPYADFEPLDKVNAKPYDLPAASGHATQAGKREMRLVPLKDDGTPDIDALNAEFSKEYLAEKRNPRWVAKPTVAYLWARTVQCKNCRATVPLLKSRWLFKKRDKRVLLTMQPNADLSAVQDTAQAGKMGVIFGIQNEVPEKGGNAAQKREHDKRLGAGTMSRAGAKCPCCGTIMTMEDLRTEGKAGHLGMIPTAVVVSGQKGKEYREPTEHEVKMAEESARHIDEVFAEIPFGIPAEPMPNEFALGMRVPKYGFSQWQDLFTPRQLAVLGTFVKHIRQATSRMKGEEYPTEWVEAITAYLACVVGKITDYNSSLVAWQPGGGKGANTFQRWALPMKWDFCENNILDSDSGGWDAVLNWVTAPIAGSLHSAAKDSLPPHVLMSSATNITAKADLIVTDPPYYDAIPYSDCMDFFYVWLRRILNGLSVGIDSAFNEPLSPKWDHEKNDGELIDDESRHDGNAEKSKAVYEDGMFRAFKACHGALISDGRLVIVFAHKEPDAWETLVSAIIRAGFVVYGSWPIQTEMGNRSRAMASAALASSVWLVCKKRPPTARPGWDNKVLEDMRANITTRLREFWDAGVRGPDFVWAATGPALEAYSKHPVVKKANAPGQVMTVDEFLTHVRRMVVDFVVGQMLTGDGNDADLAAADRMDAPTAYYLLHRHDFGLGEAPSGACILYAVSCGLSDRDLETTWNLLARTGGKSSSNGDEDAEPDPDADTETVTASGSRVKLKTWAQRKHKSMGYEAPGGQPIPLIDRVHRLMHLWKAGDVHKVDEYLDDHGLRRHELFKRLLQSLIELSRKDACLRATHRQGGSQELQVLESLSNHVQAKGARFDDGQMKMTFGENN